MRRLASSRRVVALLDRNRDGKPDTESDATTVIADTIERACNWLDLSLGQVYVVPFAAVSASTPCHGIVSDVTDLMVVSLLYRWVDPKSEDAKAARKDVDEALAKLLDGSWEIPDAAKVAAADGARSAAHESVGTAAAGAETGGVRNTAWDSADTTLVDQTRGL